MELLSSALLYKQDGSILTEESENNINRLFSFMKMMCKNTYKEMYDLTLEAMKKDDFQGIQKIYTIYSYIYFLFRDSQNGLVNYLYFLHRSNGSKEEKGRVVCSYLFPEFANDSAFKLAVEGFLKSELSVFKCNEVSTWCGNNGNKIRQQIDENVVKSGEGVRYLSQILLITNSKVSIKNYYGIGNVIELSKEEIENHDHNYIGKIVDEIKYLRI